MINSTIFLHALWLCLGLCCTLWHPAYQSVYHIFVCKNIHKSESIVELLSGLTLYISHTLTLWLSTVWPPRCLMSDFWPLFVNYSKTDTNWRIVCFSPSICTAFRGCLLIMSCNVMLRNGTASASHISVDYISEAFPLSLGLALIMFLVGAVRSNCISIGRLKRDINLN